jgi:glycerophosphoryl diester phosphodiesterase
MPHNLIHRGLAKKNFKENTLQAFKYCFQKNFGIETDLHVTKDNKIICFHDFSLKKKFKLNKYVKNLTFNEINKVAKKFNYHVPELKELIKISKNKHYLMLEIKSNFTKNNLVELINQIKKLKFYSITSFNEKMIKDLYKLKKKLHLGVVFASTTKISKIIKKSRLPHVKILVMEKRYLLEKKLNIIKKPIYFYTARNKDFKKKYKENNLIFEII